MNGCITTAGVFALSALLVSTGCGAGGGGGGGARGELINLSECPAGLDTQALAAEAAALGNDERAQVGVPALTVDPVLTAVAEDYAQTMGIQGFTGHVDPNTGEDGGDRLDAAGYVWTARAENLEYGACSAQQAVDDWMNSSEHRDHLLDPAYTETGVGLYQGGEEGTYWVQVFATP